MLVDMLFNLISQITSLSQLDSQFLQHTATSILRFRWGEAPLKKKKKHFNLKKMKKSEGELQKWDPSSMMDRHAIDGMYTEQTTKVKLQYEQSAWQNYRW